MKRLLSGSWLVAVVAVLSACPPTGVVCKPGTVPCGTGCVDPTSDRRNCGACGTACFTGQDCNAGTCACRVGTTTCGSDCAVLDYDAKNCGRCGNQCAVGQVCELGVCQQSCSMGLTRCGASCLDTSHDTLNCGGCGVVCAQGMRCTAGTCEYPAIAACYWSGQIVGFDPATGVKGPLSDVGSNPAALANVGGTTLVSDQTDHRIYSAAPTPSGAYALSKYASPAGSVATQLLVDRPYVYVVNAGSGSVLVLQEGVDAGVIVLDAGVDGTLVLGTVTEVQLGMNTFPQGVAKVGSTLWVPLYGGFDATSADAGQELAKIDVTNPAAPMLTGRVSLKNIDLLAFDGGAPVPRPWAITTKGTDVYVALNNLNANSYVPEGPGLVAKVDTTNDMVSAVMDLGATQCLNPQWLSFAGDTLVVSCGGKINYSPTFSVESVVAAGAVAVTAAGVVLPNTFNASGVADVDAGFLPMMPGRFAVSGGQVVLTDQNGGRVAVLALTDAGVTEVRGVNNALAICPVSPLSGVANVADVVAR
jgi:hypothetical protein